MSHLHVVIVANGSAPDSSITAVTIDTSRTVGVVFGLLNPYETSWAVRAGRF